MIVINNSLFILQNLLVYYSHLHVTCETGTCIRFDQHLSCFAESTMQYLRHDRVYTHSKHGIHGVHSDLHGPWARDDGAFGRLDGRYSELELYNIKAAFSLIDSLWIDMSLGCLQVKLVCS